MFLLKYLIITFSKVIKNTNGFTMMKYTPTAGTTTPSFELPNTGSIRDAYWVLSAIFATIGAIVFVTNKKAEEK